MRVLEEISRGPEGFRGSVYAVRRYLHKIRPDRGRVYQEVIYEPGEAMQVDWGDCGKLEIGQTTRRVSVFVAVLCYSRLCYIEFTLSQHKAEFYRAMVNALNFFRRQSQENHFRQPACRRDQWLGASCLFAPGVPGALRLFLHGTDRVRESGPGIEGDGGRDGALCERECPGRTE